MHELVRYRLAVPHARLLFKGVWLLLRQADMGELLVAISNVTNKTIFQPLDLGPKLLCSI